MGERLADGLAVIERNAQLQARLIEDPLDISRITAGQLHLTVEPVYVTGLIETALEAIPRRPKSIFASRHTCPTLRLFVEEPASAGHPERADECGEVHPPDGAVTITSIDEGSSVQIVVADTGVGFPSEFAPYILAFRPADTSFGRPHAGLGLGAAIARPLVEAHGGRIEASSPGPNHTLRGNPLPIRGKLLPSPHASDTRRREVQALEDLLKARIVAQRIEEGVHGK